VKLGPLVIGKDGGPDSNVDGVMFEIKRLFSIGILRFKDGSREAWHSHAFNCWSVVLKGRLLEMFFDPSLSYNEFKTGDFIYTKREDLHKVASVGTSYVLTVRGPWKKTWVDVEEVTEHGPLAHFYMVKTLTDTRAVERAEFFETRSAAGAHAWRAAQS